ncbi:MAG: hypothetical protein C4576_25055 [Desulfobacteraceae bacterium]|nr:MAG: hypothetical protein C4576_25055 [Desulfobacteraceae bacterium]
MKTGEAILALVQSEKIKSAVISITQTLEMVAGLGPGERAGGEKVIKILLGMAAQEVLLARTIATHKDWDWEGIESLLERSAVLADSGVAQEANIHLARAISLITTIGQRAMTFLEQEHLLQ